MTDESRSTDSVNDRTKEFLRLLGKYEPSLRGYVFSLVPHTADAEEIIQDTRIRLWEQFDEYDPAKDFGAWSRTIAHYLVLAFREKSSRHRRLLSDEFLDSVSQTVEEQPEQLDGRRLALRECLGRLERAKRDLLMAYYSGKETAKQIAARVGRSYQGVRQMILRTRKDLAACIKESLDEENAS